MTDPALNNLLKWGVQNSTVPQNGQTTAPPPPPPKPINESDREAFQYMVNVMSGKSDFQAMLDNMAVVENEEAEAEARYIAFDNFDILIQSIDNAHNLEHRSLWERLLKFLHNEDPKLRQLAAACCSSAVQNNIRSQKQILIYNDAIPTLVRLATTESNQEARKSAISALSSTVRNFQPGLDAVLTHMPHEYKPQEKLDADDMDSVDILIKKLRKSNSGQ